MTPFRWPQSLAVAVGLVIATGVFVFLLARSGFRASREWRRSSVSLVERRATEAASLLATALNRDMRSVQMSVLSSPAWDEFTYDTPHDVPVLVGSAFARYPYPDAFLAWRAGDPEARMVFFTRSERPPRWSHLKQEPQQFPVRAVTDSGVAASILSAVRPEIGRRVISVADLNIDGIRYQLVAQLRYRDQTRQHLASLCGFLVDLNWVREHYFPEFATQMAQIDDDDVGLAYKITDDDGQTVVTTSPFVNIGLVSNRQFPLMFFDPAVVAVNPPEKFKPRNWNVTVSGADDPDLAAAIRGSNRTLGLAAIGAFVFGIGLVLTAWAARARAEVAEMRAEFVASVTHELKTPIASIRALGHALKSGRVNTRSMQQEYGGLVVQESKRLARLVDNLLAHARVTDIADIYTFEPLSIRALVQTAVGGFNSQLTQAGFDVTVDVPESLPFVRADRAAMELLLDNLIDNSIRYSKTTRTLAITAATDGNVVRLQVADRGVGIPVQDLPRVTRKFARGHNVPSGGSGLGLAIVKRIVHDHGGTLFIDSVVGEGTTVAVELPIAREPVAAEEPSFVSSGALPRADAGRG